MQLFLFILKLCQTHAKDATEKLAADEACAAVRETLLCSETDAELQQAKSAIAVPDADTVSARWAQAAL